MRSPSSKILIVWLCAFAFFGLGLHTFLPDAFRIPGTYAASETPGAAGGENAPDDPGSDPAPQPDDMQTEPGTVGRFLERITPDTGSPPVDASIGKLFRSISGMVDGFIALLPNLAIALFVLVVVFFLARLASTAVARVARQAKLRGSLTDLFSIFAKVGVWLAGLVTAAGIVFPEFGLSEILTTAGLASVAIGFAFKDIFENFFAGILILWRFPFENGDFIEADGLMGKVEDVEIRMTRIRQPDGELRLIPNAQIFNRPVRVITDRPLHRVEVAVGVAYGEDVGTARSVILKAVESCDTVDQGTPPEVLLSGFGASSMDYDVIWWCDAKPLQTRRSKNEVIEAIKRALDKAGIEIPYPYRTLTFTRNEPDIIRAVEGRNLSGNGPRAAGEGGD